MVITSHFFCFMTGTKGDKGDLGAPGSLGPRG